MSVSEAASDPANLHSCDVCGRPCKRLHFSITCQTDTYACDECAGYDPEAYGESVSEADTDEGSPS
jgi:hypothetical protein